MSRNAVFVLSAAFGLTCAVSLSGCGNEPNGATTGKPAVAEIPTEQPVTPPAPTRPDGQPLTDAEVERMRAERAAAAEARAEAARVAREAALAERAERASRDARPSRPAVISTDPGILDLGTMATGERRTGSVRLTNTSDTVVRLVDSRTSCGCTVANVPKNYDMAPGESVEVDVSLAGSQRAERLTKNVTFIFEEHPNVVVQVTGETVAYVAITPHILDPERHPDGRVVIQSNDGEPFRIISVNPLISLDVPAETATEHEFHVSWDEWAELHQPRRLSVTIDHPKTKNVVASIRAPRHVHLEPRQDPRTASDSLHGREPRQARPVDLHVLARAGNKDQILPRLSEDADLVDSVDERGMNLLGVAARHGHVDLMRALIDAGANVNHASRMDGRTPLMTAVESKNTETVRILLEAGADVNAQDTNFGTTALSWGSLVADRVTIAALVNAGAEVNNVNRMTGWTPLHTAAGFNDERGVVKTLVEAGANIDPVCTIHGFTPIMYAAMTGRMDNLKVLLEAGANLETADPNGRTVLLVAAANGGADAAMIKALLDAGANVRATDARGENALDLVKYRNDPRRDEVKAVLEPLFNN